METEVKGLIKKSLYKRLVGHDEIDTVLKEQYPDIYRMKQKGVIKDVLVYRFLDKNTGEILTEVSYNRNFPKRPFGRFGR